MPRLLADAGTKDGVSSRACKARSCAKHKIHDAEIIRSLQSGDQEALGLLFDRYSGLIFTTAFKIFKSHADAEDVTQEVFLYLLRRGSNFDPAKGTLASWVFQVARTKALNHRQRKSARLAALHDPFEDAHQIADPHVDPQRITDGLFLAEILEQALEKLTEAQQETLRLCVMEGYSLVEASQKRNEQLGNTRHHYYRAIAALRAAVNSH